MSNTPHLPWAPSARTDEVIQEGPFLVEGLEHVEFIGTNWKFGGTVFYASCTRCGKKVQAGGLAGRSNLIRWGERHPCGRPSGPVCEGEEDKNLFRD